MNTRAELLTARRRRLLAESQALRVNLTQELEPLAHTLTALDSGLRIAARVRQHPEWLAGAALALVLLRPSRVSGWLRGAATGLRVWRQFGPLLRVLTSG